MPSKKKHHDWQTSLISGGNIVSKPKTKILTDGGVKNNIVKSRKNRPLRIATDRYENQNNNFGMVGYDPVASTFFRHGLRMSLNEIEALYRQDWLTQRIIEALPNAAMQKGFGITSKKNPDGAEKVLEILKKWKTKERTKQVNYQARLYGGAAKINFVNDGLPTAYPINWPMVRSVDRFVILGRYYCRPHVFYSDPFDLKTFNQPWIYQSYEISYGASMPTYDVHNQRLTWINGTYLPDHLKITNWGAGDTVLERVQEICKAHGTSIQSIAATIQDFVTKVLQIEDMDDLLEENEPELRYRVEMANAANSIHKTSVIGPGESLKKISTPITGLPDSIVLIMDVASAAADQPKSILFGNLTGTLGSSSGKHDRLTWHDKVETFQQEKCEPVIVDDMRLAAAITGVDTDDFEIVWPDLTEKGEKETAETRKLNAEAHEIELRNEKSEKNPDNNDEL